MSVSQYLLPAGIALLFLDFAATVFSSRFTTDNATSFGLGAVMILVAGALARAIESDPF